MSSVVDKIPGPFVIPSAPAFWTGSQEEFAALLVSFAADVLELFAARADAAQRFDSDDLTSREFNRGVVAAALEAMHAVSSLRSAPPPTKA